MTIHKTLLEAAKARRVASCRTAAGNIATLSRATQRVAFVVSEANEESTGRGNAERGLPGTGRRIAPKERELNGESRRNGR